jgi:hypothetical protein
MIDAYSQTRFSTAYQCELSHTRRYTERIGVRDENRRAWKASHPKLWMSLDKVPFVTY